MQDEEEAFNRFLAHKHWQAHTHTHSADTPTRKEEKKGYFISDAGRGIRQSENQSEKRKKLGISNVPMGEKSWCIGVGGDFAFRFFSHGLSK